MLQRAASNAYSWWWSSHIRTKQSKWLEQSLQDMEEKVHGMLKVIEEDGDSFAKRAEMYYKRRPELINFVQESFRGYRALAERYDKISKELQNANNTIATLCPEQVQFAMDDDDDYESPKTRKRLPRSQPPKPTNAPSAPTAPVRDLKGILTTASKKLQAKKTTKPPNLPAKSRPKSGLTKPEAVAEIDKLQKEILALQTVKEFVKSSYESGLAKYWDIDNKITGFQDRVSGLQDEFSIANVIEDDEARTLMVKTALRSCDETLTQLQEKQEKSTHQAQSDFKKVETAREKLKNLRNKFLPDQKAEETTTLKAETMKLEETRQEVKSQEIQELDALREKIKEHFDVGDDESLTMTELAERIDELVSKVISLETSVSSQTALIDRLRTETDDLQEQIQNLEDDKANLMDDRNSLNKTIQDLEEKLKRLQNLNHNVEDHNNNLSSVFTEARHSLRHLSETLQTVKSDEGVEESSSHSVVTQTVTELGKHQDKPNPTGDSKEAVKKEEEKVADKTSEKNEDLKSLNKVGEDDKNDAEKEKDSRPPLQKVEEVKEASRGDKNDTEKEKESQLAANRSSEKSEDPKPVVDKNDPEKEKESQLAENRSSEKSEDSKPVVDKNDAEKEKSVGEDNIKAQMQELDLDKEDCENWQKLLQNDLEDREKAILSEYTAVLRNFKDVKKKLTDAENKNKDNLFEIAQRDEEISSLRHKLNLTQENPEGNAEENGSIPLEKPAESASLMNDEDDRKLMEMVQPQSLSPVEEKFRTNIDALLDENLEFWLRFSTSYHQIQKFKTGFQDLQEEVSKIKEKEKEKEKEREKEKEKDKDKDKDKSAHDGSTPLDIISDIRPIYKHMSEIQAELAVWIEQSGLLKDELQRRFSSLCSIEEDIIKALEAGAETEEMKFTSHEAAKFRGEVLNMKQENKKVRKELMGGLDHITVLQLEIEKTLAQLDEEYDISGSKKAQLRHSTSRNKIPLRSFIFGTKPKKKTSIFSCRPHRRSALLM